jgi:N utilization substance protein B
MGRRRDARERALQVLFELEFNDSGPESVLARRRAEEDAPAADVQDHAAWLVKGVVGRRDEIDGIIQATSTNWRVARMGLIDRNLLRLAVFEMLEDPALVPAIVINEAIEIARRFSGDTSAVFVNGVLDAIRRARSGGEGKAPTPALTGAGETPVRARKTKPAPAPRTPRKKKDSHERPEEPVREEGKPRAAVRRAGRSAPARKSAPRTGRPAGRARKK